MHEQDRLLALASYGILDTPCEERFDRVTRLVARTLRVPIAFINLLDKDRVWSKSVYGVDLREQALSDFPEGTCLCEEVVLQGGPLVLEDAAADPRFARNPLVAGAPGIRAYAGVPIRTSDGLRLGVLGAADVVPRALSREELDVLEDLAGIVSDELEHTRRAQEAVQEAERIRKVEARFGSLVRNGSDLIALLSASGRVLYHSPSVLRILGYTPDELLAVSLFDLIHPDDANAARNTLHGLALGQKNALLELRVRTRQGAWRWVESTFTNLLDDPAVEGIVVNTRDVTERKKRNTRLVEKQRILEMIARRASLPEIFSAICRLVEGQIEGTACSILLAEENVRLRHGAAPSLPDAYCEAIDGIPIGPGSGSCGTAAYLGKAVITPDIGTDPRWKAFREAALAHGLRACFSTPLLSNEDTVSGTFAIYYPEPQIPNEADRLLVEVATNLAGIAMESHHAEKAVKEREQSFRALVESTSGLLWRLDPDGKKIMSGPLWEAYTGQPQEESNAFGWIDRIHPEDRDGLLDEWQECFATLEGREFEARVRGRDGSYRWFAGRMVPVFDEDGALREWIGTATDITERREAEAALRASEAALRTSERFLDSILENLPLPVFVKDARNHRFVQLNKAAEALFGYPREAFLGKTDYDFYPKEVADLYTAMDRDVVARGIAVNIPEEPLPTADRDVRILHTRKVPVRDDAGQPRYVVGIAEDVTERKRHEAELLEAKEKAEEMSRLKTSFLANMSHEIRTPLTSIIGFSEVLASDFDGEGSAFVQIIHDNGTRLLETLNSVMDLAQLESSSVEIQREMLDLSAVARKSVPLFRKQAEDRGLTLRLVTPEEPVRAELDRAAVGRILSNLLSNAVKFTREGSIVVSVGRDDERAWIRVEDTGIGIGRAFLPYLFDEFRQESSGLARSYEGSGLGLTITKRLVELLDGEITVESEKDRGSVFTVRFPAPVPEPPAPEPTEAPVHRTEPTRQRILAVEDNRETQMLLDVLLRQHYDVVFASSVDEAIETARNEAFDAALVDINLSEKRTGIDVMHALRAMRGDTTPIIACTAYALPEDRERFLEAGFDGYIAKPFRRHDVVQVLDALLALPSGEATAETAAP